LASPWGICGGRSGNGRPFVTVVLFSASQLHSTNDSTSINELLRMLLAYNLNN